MAAVLSACQPVLAGAAASFIVPGVSVCSGALVVFAGLAGGFLPGAAGALGAGGA